MDEYILCNNFDIRSSATLHFQDPATKAINNGEMTLFERMFLAGLRLSFPAIAQELLLLLKVAPSPIVPNVQMGGTSLPHTLCDQWSLKDKMTIPEFFNIYRPSVQHNWTIAFQVRQNPLFIYLWKSYSNNKYWEEQFFCVSREWEFPITEVLPED
jgi:hypothetical protein